MPLREKVKPFAVQIGLFVAVMRNGSSNNAQSTSRRGRFPPETLREAEALALIRDGFWQIDQQGRLWSVKQWVPSSKAEPPVVCATNPIPLGWPGTDGYLRVALPYDSIRYACRVDRLVWRHFHGQIHPGWTIVHKNGVKRDNRIENLELMTPNERAQSRESSARTVHSVRPEANRSAPVVHSGRPQPYGRPSQLTGDQVLKIGELLQSGVKIKLLATQYGVSSSRIYQIKSALRWTHSVERSDSASLDQQPMAR